MKPVRLSLEDANMTLTLLVNNGIPTDLSQAPFTLENGKADLETDLVSKSGLTVQNMSVNGVTIGPMAKANLFMLTEMYMKDSGPTIKQTDLELTNT